MARKGVHHLRQPGVLNGLGLGPQNGGENQRVDHPNAMIILGYF